MADLATILGKAAPWLAAAAAGPAGLAGMAIKTVAEAVGAPSQAVDDVATAVMGAKPEQIVALRQAEQEFKLRMQELGFKSETDLQTIAAADRADARKMQTSLRSFVPAALTWMLLCSFVGTLVSLFVLQVPASNRDIVVYMVGQLSGFTAAAVAFWLGTTRDSQNKTGLIAKAEPIK